MAQLAPCRIRLALFGVNYRNPSLLHLPTVADSGLTLTFTVGDVTKEGWYYDRTSDFSYPEPPSGSTSSLGAPKLVKAYPNALENAFPNPGNPETWIPFTLSGVEHVFIRIYHGSGHLVRILDLGQKAPGAYIAKEKAAYWDGRN